MVINRERNALEIERDFRLLADSQIQNSKIETKYNMEIAYVTKIQSSYNIKFINLH